MEVLLIVLGVFLIVLGCTSAAALGFGAVIISAVGGWIVGSGISMLMFG